jgi:hypothetical protein
MADVATGLPGVMQIRSRSLAREDRGPSDGAAAHVGVPRHNVTETTILWREAHHPLNLAVQPGPTKWRKPNTTGPINILKNLIYYNYRDKTH